MSAREWVRRGEIWRYDVTEGGVTRRRRRSHAYMKATEIVKEVRECAQILKNTPSSEKILVSRSQSTGTFERPVAGVNPLQIFFLF